MRSDGRNPFETREVSIIPGFAGNAYGSCLIAFGKTRVIVTASLEEGVPPFLRGSGKGWLTAEYAMLPASTNKRKAREYQKRDGRSVEISRLIGRALRQAIHLESLGEYTITLDCDVLQADGGTRTAAITGAFVALCFCVNRMLEEGKVSASPIIHQVAALSCGLIGDQALIDLCYQEDSQADADINFVMNENGDLIEIQGAGEGRSFSKAEMDSLYEMAKEGIFRLMLAQRRALKEAALVITSKPFMVLASNNAHKIKELRQMLGSRYTVLGMREAGLEMDIEETGETFEANAIIKAEAVRDALGCAALADDSGLQVEALNGEPGVYSARYAGNHGDDRANNELLIRKMEGVEDRRAHFVSALALANPGEETRVFIGRVPGQVTLSPRGDGGFGYDPYFEYENGETFAQMSAELKNQISHRARAMQKLLEALS